RGAGAGLGAHAAGVRTERVVARARSRTGTGTRSSGVGAGPGGTLRTVGTLPGAGLGALARTRSGTGAGTRSRLGRGRTRRLTLGRRRAETSGGVDGGTRSRLGAGLGNRRTCCVATGRRGRGLGRLGTRTGLGAALRPAALRSAGAVVVVESLFESAYHRRLDRRGRRTYEFAHLLKFGKDSLALHTKLFSELVYPDLRHCSPLSRSGT